MYLWNKKDDQTKGDKILQAGIKLFSEKGLDKTTISDIVNEAGVAKGTFYLYFQSKNSLVPAIAEDMLQKILARMKEATSEEEPFKRQVEIIVDETFSVTQEYKEVLILCYSGLSHTNVLDEWERIYTPYYEWLENLLVKAQQNNQINQNIDIGLTAKMLVALIEGVAEQIHLFDNQTTITKNVRRELIQFILNSLSYRAN